MDRISDTDNRLNISFSTASSTREGLVSRLRKGGIQTSFERLRITPQERIQEQSLSRQNALRDSVTELTIRASIENNLPDAEQLINDLLARHTRKETPYQRLDAYTNPSSSTTIHQSHSQVTTKWGQDTVTILGSHNTVHTQNSNNNVYVEGGHNAVTSGSGEDSYEISGHNNVISSDGSADVLNVSGRNNTLQTGAGDDAVTVKFTAKNTIILGGAGNDTVTFEGKEGDYVISTSGSYTLYTHALSGYQTRLAQVETVNFLE